MEMSLVDIIVQNYKIKDVEIFLLPQELYEKYLETFRTQHQKYYSSVIKFFTSSKIDKFEPYMNIHSNNQKYRLVKFSYNGFEDTWRYSAQN